MNREKFVIFLLLITMIALWFIQSLIESKLVIDDDLYTNLMTQINDVEKQNDILEEQVLYESSLTHIAQQAKKDGFIPATQIYYLH